MDMEKVMENMNIAKAVLCNSNMVTPEMCIMIGQTISDAISMLKEQDNWLGMHQTADGITFISSGTAKQGEKRGIMLGKALIYERLEKELKYRGLLTDDIRSAFAKVWGELE